MISIDFYGGVDEISGNKILVDYTKTSLNLKLLEISIKSIDNIKMRTLIIL